MLLNTRNDITYKAISSPGTQNLHFFDKGSL